jgi:Holliday junction resolvase RusA-like endonuclease
VLIVVKGDPVPSQRPRMTRRGKVYPVAKCVEYQKTVTLAAQEQGGGVCFPEGQPLKMGLVFRMPRPKAHYGTGKNSGVLKATAPTAHTSKPDVDNLIKGVIDGLAGVVFHDDRQIARLTVEKRYVDPEHPDTGVAVLIEAL